MVLKRLNVQPESTSAPDRRTTPHYLVKQQALIRSGKKETLAVYKILLLDLSFFGARISSRQVLAITDAAKLEIPPIKATPLLQFPVRIESLEKAKDTYFYSLKFGTLTPLEKEQLAGYLKTFTIILNRREEQLQEPQKQERRLKLGTLTKSVRYARLDYLRNLKNQGNNVFLREVTAIDRELYCGSKKMVSFSSNDYLGLSTHPEVIESAVKALEKYGLTSASSRLLAGTYDLHRELEDKLAKFKGGESCLLFNTGYTTNLSVIFSMVGPQDIVLVDEKDHASIMDGLTMAAAQVHLFRHNDPKSLLRLLQKFKDHNKIIIIDGVYSMDGDIAQLDNIYPLAQEYNVPIMIDDAHGTGVLGKNGKGTSEHFGLSGKIEMEVGTLSKGLGAMGGFIVTSEKIIDFLRYTGRTFIFSVSMPAAITAGALKALELLQTRPEIREQLWNKTNYMLSELKLMGYNTSSTSTPIIPLVIGNETKTYELSKLMEDEGIIASAVAWPAVKKRESRIRLTVRANHTDQEIEQSLKTFKKIGKQLNLI